jgi:hypothetical protein
MNLMAIPVELQREVFNSLRNLRGVREKAEKRFSAIRNTAIAHRDPNAMAQYRAIRDLKVNDVWQVAAEFFAAIQSFMSVHSELMIASNNLVSYVNQWSASTKARGLESDAVEKRDLAVSGHSPTSKL